MEHISNYEITKRRVQKDFLKYDQEKMIEKFSLKSDENYMYINFIGHLYRICRNTGFLEWSEDDFATCVEGDFNEALTIYDLLCDSKEYCHASGDYVNLQSMSTIQGSSKKLGNGLFYGKDKIFDQKDELFSRVCERLGGVKAGKGDVAYELPLFDFVSCRIQFWNSDEEFEATLQIFMDKNILDFIRYETVWYATSHLMKRLTEELDNIVQEVKASEEWKAVKMSILEIGIERGTAIGMERGLERGAAKQLIESVENVAANLKVSIEKACEIVGTSIEAFENAKVIVKKS